MPKVLIPDKLSMTAVDIFKERGINVDFEIGLSKRELIKIIGCYDGLAIRSATKVTADVLDAASNLKVVGRAGIGVDNIDVAAATAKGIVVMNTPFGNSITTAEHAVAMLLALARQIPSANTSTQDGKWEKSKFIGVEVTSKTLGIIGCGNIGSIVADRAKGLHMRVIAYDPFLSPERADQLGFDGVCVNDHHQTCYGLMPSPNLMAAALARRTKRAKIAILGNAICLRDHPLRVAEEVAMLDGRMEFSLAIS